MASDPMPNAQASTGFFGKVPSAGDFVARGLAPGVRSALDHFLTAKFGEAARHPERWPEAGVRAAIKGPAEPLLLCIVPSLDAHKRAFPVAACVALNRADQASANRWADTVVEPLWFEDNVDALFSKLQTAAPPPSSENPIPVPSLWIDTRTPSDLDQTLSTLFLMP